MGWFFDKVATVKQAAIEERKPQVEQWLMKEKQLTEAMGAKKKTQETADQFSEWMQARFAWADILCELRRALQVTEATTKRPGVRTGVWIEKMVAENSEVPETLEEEEAPRPMMMDLRMMIRYGLLKGVKLVPDGAGGGGGEGGGGGGVDPSSLRPSAPKAAPASTNEITVVNLTCRGISWNKVYATADSELAYALLKELQTSPLFATGTNGTQLAGSMQQNEENGTFSFDVKLKLKKPIKL
jgi:hypothetical protein